MDAPEFPRPWVRRPPGIDDATGLGVIEVNAVVQRHSLQGADGAAKAERENGHLADRAFGLCYRPRVLVQDVSGGERVDVRQRGIAIVGAEDIQDLIGAGRSGEPRINSRLDHREIGPIKYFPRPGNEGGTDDKGQLARGRHVDRIRRDQVGIAAAVGDRIDERSLRAAVLAEDITGQVVNLRPARAQPSGLPGAGKPILTAKHAVDLLRIDAGELFW